MIHRLPIVILVVAVLAAALMLAERPVVREGALMSHRPAVAIAAPESGTMHAATAATAPAAPASKTNTAADPSIPLHKRRAYKPRPEQDLVVASVTPSGWVCVPGTGVALWPKPAS